jgi:hypothetical protein
MAKKLLGVDTSKSDIGLKLEKDLTPSTVKFSRYLRSEGFWQLLVALFIGTFFVPSMAELIYLIGFIFAWRNIKNAESLPYKKPETSGDKEDLNEIHPGHGRPDKPQGISFFGNEIGTKKEVWFTNSDVRTHCLIFGTTGAGKALRSEENILTPEGWVKNKDLKVGQFVSTPSGKSEILGVFPQGELKLFKINFSNDKTIEVSGDHLWEVSSYKFPKMRMADNSYHQAKIITTVELMDLLKEDNDLFIPVSKNYKEKLKVISVEKTNKIENCQCIKIKDPRGLYITKDNIVTHNTETLLSICVNSLNQASGFLYIDGKGDNSLWAKVFSLCASRGRLDDLYLINYMTSSVNLDRKTTERITNKMNPFATGNSDSLTELIVSLLPDGGGDGMWKGRAAVFMGALLKSLVFLRDEGKLLLDVDVVRKYFTLSEIVKLSRRSDIPKKYIDGIREYVKNLPGYIEPTPANPDPEQPEAVAEQHGYISMQYTETFGLLADQYAHIMKTQVAEIDFYDIVVNRRILVVLLPALEKSKQSLSNLGRIIIASIKNMMSSTLGSMVEGSVEDVIETKPTNAPSPYLTIFDEYGYYATEGAAVMPAQARSLGFMMVFAGQDYQAFKKGSEEEAASIVANCAIKICMKLEDPTETLKIFQDAAGREKVIEQSSFEQDDQSMNAGAYQASKSVSVTEKDIINTRDLRNQGAGEAHMLFMDTTRRIKMFYAAPKPLKETRVNTFLEIEPPTYENVKLMKTGFNRINKKVKDITKEPKIYNQSIQKAMKHYSSSELDSVFKLLNVGRGQKNIFKAAFAIAGYIEKINIIDNKIVSDIRGNIDKFNEVQELEETVIKYKEDTSSSFEDKEVRQKPNKPNKPNKEIKKEEFKETKNSANENSKVTEEDIDSIFENDSNENVDRTLKQIKDTLNDKYEELEYLDNQEDSFESFEKFEEMGLALFSIQEQLNETEQDLQNKLYEKSVINNEAPSQQNPEHNSLVVENNIIDLGLSTNKTTQKPNKDKKQLQKEVEDMISSYFD